MIKERKERKKQEEGLCVEEATVTHYFPHTEDRDGVQLLFVSESLGEKSHTHTVHVTHTHRHTQIQYTHRHTLTFQTEHGSSLHCNIYPPETNSTSSSLSLTLLHPPLLLPPQRWAKAFAHRNTNPDTHTCTPLSPAASRHRPPSLSPPCTHTHTEWRAANFSATRTLLGDPSYCSTSLSLSLSTSPSSQNISPPC